MAFAFSASDGIVVKFSTLAGGVFIEVHDGDEYQPSDRCFRFDDRGFAEWASYGDLTSGNPAPRWFAHSFKADRFTLC